jgi:hypothetical protein
MSNEITRSPVAGLRSRAPMRLLHRFTKLAVIGQRIRERKVTQFQALEFIVFIVFIAGSLIAGQMFHGSRKGGYSAAIKVRIAQLTEGGWSIAAGESSSVQH